MRNITAAALITLLATACQVKVNTGDNANGLPIQGTWKLLTGTLIEKKDTTVTDYTIGKSFIKIINNDHFAFFKHDLTHGKDSLTKVYSSGGGLYTLKDSSYTEHLEYCDAREWEGHDFNFTISVQNDTLTIKGVERIDSIGVNRYNTERYVRLK